MEGGWCICPGKKEIFFAEKGEKASLVCNCVKNGRRSGSQHNECQGNGQCLTVVQENA